MTSIRQHISCIGLMLVMFLKPASAYAQGPNIELRIRAEAEAVISPTARDDVLCPAHFAPIVIQATAQPDVRARGFTNPSGPLIRRSARVERVTTAPAAQSNIYIDVTGCRLGHHFVPLSAHVTLQVDLDGFATYRHEFTTEGGDGVGQVTMRYEALLMGPRGVFGFTHRSEPITLTNSEVLGELWLSFLPTYGGGDECVDAVNCTYIFRQGRFQLVVTES